MIAWSRGLDIDNPIPAPDIALYESTHLADVLRYGLQSGLRMALSPTKYFDWDLVMLTCAFAGMASQRAGFFETLSQRRRQLRFWCFGAIAFAIASAAVQALGWVPRKRYEIAMWPMLGQMVCFMAALCWLFVADRLPRLFESLRAVGRMTLTNYLVQNLAGMLIFSGFGLGKLHQLPYWTHVTLAILVFAVQVAFSRAWLKKRRLGPVESLWRGLSGQRAQASS